MNNLWSNTVPRQCPRKSVEISCHIFEESICKCLWVSNHSQVNNFSESLFCSQFYQRIWSEILHDSTAQSIFLIKCLKPVISWEKLMDSDFFEDTGLKITKNTFWNLPTFFYRCARRTWRGWNWHRSPGWKFRSGCWNKASYGSRQIKRFEVKSNASRFTLWQLYVLWSFQAGGTRLERFLHG